MVCNVKHIIFICIFPSSFHDRANKATYAALRQWWRRWWRAYAYMIIYFKFIHIIAVPVWLYNNNIIIFYSRPKLLILWIVRGRGWHSFAHRILPFPSLQMTTTSTMTGSEENSLCQMLCQKNWRFSREMINGWVSYS